MSLPPAPVRTRWGLVWFLWLVGVIGAFQLGKVPPALPILREQLGIGLAMSGLVLSSFSILAATAGAAIGLAADRIGYRRTLLAGLAACAVGSALGAASLWLGPWAVAWLLAARLVEGAGFLAIVTAAPTLIATVARPGDRSAAMGIWGAYFPTGLTLMISASPFVLPGIGWQGVWLISAAVPLVAIAVAWPALSSLGRTAGQRAGTVGGRREMLRILRAPGPLTCGLTFGCYSMQWLSIMGFLPLWLSGDLGFGPVAASLLTALAVAANIVGNLSAGPMRRRGLRPWQAIVLASAVMGLAGAAVYQEGLPTWLRFACLLLFSGVGGLIPASLFALTAATVPQPALLGSANGLVVQVSNVGQLIGPPLLGLLVGLAGGWHIAPAMLGVAAALCLAGGLALRRLERRGPR